MAATRKTRKPLPRFCRLDGDRLHLTIGKAAFTYLVEPIPGDFGIAVRLRKLEPEYAGGPMIETKVYDVNLDGERSTCECSGFLRWMRCKHVESLGTLLAEGKLLPALAAMRGGKARRHVHALAMRIAAVTGHLDICSS